MIVDAFEQTHPTRIVKIARQFPETQVLCVRMGGNILRLLGPSRVM